MQLLLLMRHMLFTSSFWCKFPLKHAVGGYNFLHTLLLHLVSNNFSVILKFLFYSGKVSNGLHGVCVCVCV